MIGRGRIGAAALAAVLASVLSATPGRASADTGRQIAQELADHVAPGELTIVSADVSYSTAGTSFPVVFALRSDPDAAVSISVRESCRSSAACEDDLRTKIAAAGPAAQRARILVAAFARCEYELLAAEGESGLTVEGDVAITETAPLVAELQRCLDGWWADRAASGLPDGAEPRTPDVTVIDPASSGARTPGADGLPLVARLAAGHAQLASTPGLVLGGGDGSAPGLRLRPTLRGPDGQRAADLIEQAAADWAVAQGLVPGPADQLAEGGGAFFSPSRPASSVVARIGSGPTCRSPAAGSRTA